MVAVAHIPSSPVLRRPAPSSGGGTPRRQGHAGRGAPTPAHQGEGWSASAGRTPAGASSPTPQFLQQVTLAFVAAVLVAAALGGAILLRAVQGGPGDVLVVPGAPDAPGQGWVVDPGQTIDGTPLSGRVVVLPAETQVDAEVELAAGG
ncbi:MAG: hypothetical protein GY745_09635 [Actinomycetia bacterium]|nr:hypothetical protein [Actinomycetes bacterium]MCP3911266.1 hypothetical protein [Actinomycetes bacterium]MCP4085293.1 hypothetical protein [Actinomycetes bacterium]